MKILGIDPGYALVGYGIIEYDNISTKTIDYGVIETHKDMPFNDRLKKIGDAITYLLENHEIDALAIEKLFFNTNTTTAIMVAEARGVILYVCAKKGIEIFEYTPLEIKQALTGYGRAEKFQIQQMVKTLLSLKSVPKPDDTADALAVALCHTQMNKMNSIFNGKV